MWQVIINPASGSGRAAKRWQHIADKLTAAQIPHQAVFTTHRGHATELARQAIEQGFRQIMVVGGDGTNHEVMNGIMQQQTVATTAITHCLVPVGTGNDWIRTHALPRDIGQIIKNIKTQKTQLQDVGKVYFRAADGARERYFMNVAGLAYDAFITRKTNENPNFIRNKIFYFYLVLRCLFQYRPQQARITFDAQSVENQYYTINVGICKYNGGGMRLVPQAIPDDGLFALTLVRKMPIWGVILSTPFLYNGKIGKHPLGFVTQAKDIRIESLENEGILLELDGEYVGTSPIRFEIVPKALRFVSTKD
jgi:diacylglycerol kinase (ATP)